MQPIKPAPNPDSSPLRITFRIWNQRPHITDTISDEPILPYDFVEMNFRRFALIVGKSVAGFGRKRKPFATIVYGNTLRLFLNTTILTFSH